MVCTGRRSSNSRGKLTITSIKEMRWWIFNSILNMFGSFKTPMTSRISSKFAYDIIIHYKLNCICGFVLLYFSDGVEVVAFTCSL